MLLSAKMQGLQLSLTSVTVAALIKVSVSVKSRTQGARLNSAIQHLSENHPAIHVWQVLQPGSCAS